MPGLKIKKKKKTFYPGQKGYPGKNRTEGARGALLQIGKKLAKPPKQTMGSRVKSRMRLKADYKKWGIKPD